MRTSTVAFDTNQARTVGLVAVIAVLVLGLIFALAVRWIVGKIISVVIAVVLAVVLAQQRASITDSVTHCNVTFLGVHLQPSNPEVQQFCNR